MSSDSTTRQSTTRATPGRASRPRGRADVNPRESRRAGERKAISVAWCFPADTHIRLRKGDPTTELLAVADEEDAELMVVSTGGLGTASPALLGGTASALMRSAPCPVVIVPTRVVPPLDAESMRDVVCAIEGEASDAAVLGLAAELAARLGGELHAVTHSDDAIDAGELGLAADLHAVGLPTDEAVKQVAEEERAGLVVVGPPNERETSSDLNVATAIALAADGEIPVVVLATRQSWPPASSDEDGASCETRGHVAAAPLTS